MGETVNSLREYAAAEQHSRYAAQTMLAAAAEIERVQSLLTAALWWINGDYDIHWGATAEHGKGYYVGVDYAGTTHEDVLEYLAGRKGGGEGE